METIKMNKVHDFFYCYNMIFAMDISAHAKLVYTYLCRCANNNAQSFPARKTIATACNMGLTSVRNALKELVEARLLKRQEQFRDNGGQTSNLYTVYSEPYEEIVDDLGLAEDIREDYEETNCAQADVGADSSTKYAPHPKQYITSGVAKYACQEVQPNVRNTYKQVSIKNGERIRYG